MKLISGDETREMEPLLSEKVIGAMYAPTTGIISPFKLALHAAYNGAENGVDFLFNSKVLCIEDEGGHYRVHTSLKSVTADFIVNTSGESAAELERFVRSRDLVIRPKRGE